MSVLEFLIRGRREVTVAYFNHATDHAAVAERFLRSFCNDKNLSFVTGKYEHDNPGKEPTEASWREQRYAFLSGLGGPVVTGHHLGDAVEWWVFSSLRGNPTLISTTREDVPVLRPFLTSHPDEIHRHFGNYSHVEDPTNAETNYTRNFIRHVLMPNALRVNPGLFTTVKNLYKREKS